MTIDVNKIATFDEVVEAIAHHKDNLHRKLKHQQQVAEAKKEAMGAFRDELKVLKEEIQGELDIIDELEQRRQDIHTDELIRAGDDHTLE